jgi:hypothetical protein
MRKVMGAKPVICSAEKRSFKPLIIKFRQLFYSSKVENQESKVVRAGYPGRFG